MCIDEAVLTCALMDGNETSVEDEPPQLSLRMFGSSSPVRYVVRPCRRAHRRPADKVVLTVKVETRLFH